MVTFTVTGYMNHQIRGKKREKTKPYTTLREHLLCYGKGDKHEQYEMHFLID